MKYLYIDCFAGFEPLMLTGALADMGQSTDSLEKSFLPGVTLSVEGAKRMGMEATLALAESKYSPSASDKEEIKELSKIVCTDGELEGLLDKYISIRASAASLDENGKIFDKKEESVNLSVLSSVFSAIKELGVEKIYVSTIFSSEQSGLFGPYTKDDTLYISKKYNIKTRPCNEDKEILSASAAATLAALDAEHKAGFIPPGVIKIGYGAGNSELEALPNIMRLVLGEEREGDSLIFENAFSESLFESFSSASMKER